MEEKIPHKISLDRRRNGLITGVTDVISFDEEKVQVETSMGVLTVSGRELAVKRLSVEQGEIELEGSIDQLLYTESRAQKGKRLIGRLFG